MKFDKEKQSAHVAVALQTLLYGSPMDEEGLREHKRLVAREMARAEARRNPSPQLELEQSSDA